MNPEPDLFRESTGLFVLGALSPEEQQAFDAHLLTCEACAAEVRSLQATAAALPFSVMPVEPASDLRQRVLAAAAAARRPSSVVSFESRRTPRTAPSRRTRGSVTGWIAAAAGVALAAGVSLYALDLRTRLDGTERRLADAVERLADSEQRVQVASRETTAVRASLALLSAPDVIELRLAGQAPAPAAQARAFLSRSRGLLFAATNLPSIPNDRVYQLWYLTPGAPVSAGLLRPDADGAATVAFDTGPGTPTPTGLAVSIEPDGGVPAPTGAIYLVTQ
jgi:anti-sigma-K factor RskA